MADNDKTYVKMLQYVHQHYNEDITLAKLSGIFYSNPAYLGRMFTKHVGTPFAEYLASYRIKVAMNMLYYNELMVGEIAQAVGYSNLNYFYRIFKKYTGTTPTKYRSSRRSFIPDLDYATRLTQNAPQQGLESISGRIIYSSEIQSGSRPRDCAMVLLPHGELLCAYLVRREQIDMVVCVESVDGGDTWSEPRTLFTGEADAFGGISLIRMADRALGALYLRRTSRGTEFVRRLSYDGGIKWSDEVVCMTLAGEYQMACGRIARLSSGKLIAPLCRPAIGARGSEPRSIVSHFASDDDGLTWEFSRMSVRLSYRNAESGLTMPMVLEYSSGVIKGYACTDLGRQYEYESSNGGFSWTQPQPSPFTSPQLPMSAARLPNGSIIAVLNPVPADNMSPSKLPPKCLASLVYVVSPNGGLGWSSPVYMENADAKSGLGYCHPIIAADRQAIYIAYTALENAPTPRARVVVRKLSMESIKGAGAS